jgi:hypothetical protein
LLRNTLSVRFEQPEEPFAFVAQFLFDVVEYFFESHSDNCIFVALFPALLEAVDRVCLVAEKVTHGHANHEQGLTGREAQHVKRGLQVEPLVHILHEAIANERPDIPNYAVEDLLFIHNALTWRVIKVGGTWA